jgi:hypothetical protein
MLTVASLGPRIVMVDVGDSFTVTPSEEKEGTDTFRVIQKHKFKVGFFCENRDPGMLRASRESR